ncbi:gliding motility-associated C-terminal domain-containing protein [Pedobacter glucosidilyticus]|uniref:gliding motility-associated C-terminal domain-containing protein n=1 Tax=Pedobacter glucosidilyticus TaxID=1122941 RepID=UPI0026EA13C6|nr:gliding motility-associated C-terminal domain-containing protein [Pedobacter glucosidilyticus]
MKKRLILFSLLLSGSVFSKLQAQFVNNGTLSVRANGVITVKSDFINAGNGIIFNDGIISIYGNWINNSSGMAFNNVSSGNVLLSGANQSIGGLSTTRFPVLTLAGTGFKTLNVNTDVNVALDLADKELKLNDKTLTILSGKADAVKTTTGFVSTNTGGKFQRLTNLTDNYLFPLGSNEGGTLRLSNLIVSPKDNTDNIYGVTFINRNPSNDGYATTQKRFDVNTVNDKYYYVLDHVSGNTPADFTLFYNAVNDGSFNQIVSWLKPLIGWEKAGISNSQTIPGNNGFDASLTFSSLKSFTNIPVTFAGTLTNNDPFTFFNTFTPNGDGKNDRWEIKNIDLFPDNELIILNRWGAEVFNIKNYNNSKAWDGSGLSSGTYYYLLKVNVNGEPKVYKGFIALLKNE